MLYAPIFVVGVPRSGTTLLQSLLSASPDAYSLPETHFFEFILPRLSKEADETLTEEDLEQALSLLKLVMGLNPPERKRLALGAEAKNGLLTGKTLFEFVLEWYRPASDQTKELRVIEKTPLHVECMEEIFTLYTNASFVHIVRDPRNAISSILNTPFVASTCLPWHAQRWNLILHLAWTFRQIAPRNIISIRYEDLVEDTETTLKRVCAFVGLTYDLKMLVAFAEEANKNFVSSREPWKTNVRAGIIKHDVMAWTSRISQEEAWVIERYTAENMQKYGYALRAHPTFRAKLRIRRQVWAQLRMEPAALGLCMSLTNRCADSGDYLGADRLAREILCSNWRHLRNPTLQRVSRLGITARIHRFSHKSAQDCE